MGEYINTCPGRHGDSTQDSQNMKCMVVVLAVASLCLAEPEADPLHYYAAAHPYYYRPYYASGYATALHGGYQAVHRLHKREAEADPQLLINAAPYVNDGPVAGPLTAAFGDLVQTPRGLRPQSLEGFSEDLNMDGFVDPVAQAAPVVAAPVIRTVAAPAVTAPLVQAAPAVAPLAPVSVPAVSPVIRTVASPLLHAPAGCGPCSSCEVSCGDSSHCRSLCCSSGSRCSSSSGSRCSSCCSSCCSSGSHSS